VRERELILVEPQMKPSFAAAYPASLKPIPVHDQLFLEDPKKWLDTNVKPLWEG
jgi:hypothetical protein